ncbi:MAG TPA: sensor histidine kinase [Mycobacteriales bacterium]|nr:sensor histidine kinase [Mycobacteriales bacterium]
MNRSAPRLSLAAQILLLQLLVVSLTVAVAAAVGLHQLRNQITRQEGVRALAVAESVAATPQVRQAMGRPNASQTLQPLAESVRVASGLTFVVIADRNQVRLTHPEPGLIGQRLSTDASDALAGKHVVTTESGTLGRSVRAKVPIRNSAGEIIGVVSVGSLVERVGAQVREALPRLLAYVLLALLLGVVGSVLLARRLKRQTFGLEPAEIGRLLEQREATLRGIHEGLVVVDGVGRVTLVNDEALRLLDIPPDSVGRLLSDLELPSRLRDVLGGVVDGDDEIVLRAGRVLVLNRKALDVRGRPIGAVTTLRDRSRLDDLTRELDGARSVSDALRAQAHEFANRMHTVAGLLELGEHDEALAFVERATVATDELAARLTSQIGEPAVAALLLAKSAFAAERGAELRVSPDAFLPAGTDADPDALITILGNLVDNALEALGADPGWVEVLLVPREDGVLVEVRDSGPGIAPELADEVFRNGFTTKVAQSAGARGLGLALTRQACVTRGGWVDVRNEGGAVFTALLPYDGEPTP